MLLHLPMVPALLARIRRFKSSGPKRLAGFAGGLFAVYVLLLISLSATRSDVPWPEANPPPAPEIHFSAGRAPGDRPRDEPAWEPGDKPRRIRLVWPIDGTVITSGFGGRRDPINGRTLQSHRGIDIRSDCGTPVVAAAEGEVIFAQETVRSGFTVKIDHGNGWVTRYAHLSRGDVVLGDRVDAGELLGLSGASGRTTGPHLHFEISRYGEPRDPKGFDYQRMPVAASLRIPATVASCGYRRNGAAGGGEEPEPGGDYGDEFPDSIEPYVFVAR